MTLGGAASCSRFGAGARKDRGPQLREQICPAEGADRGHVHTQNAAKTQEIQLDHQELREFANCGKSNLVPLAIHYARARRLLECEGEKASADRCCPPRPKVQSLRRQRRSSRSMRICEPGRAGVGRDVRASCLSSTERQLLPKTCSSESTSRSSDWYGHQLQRPHDRRHRHARRSHYADCPGQRRAYRGS